LPAAFPRCSHCLRPASASFPTRRAAEPSPFLCSTPRPEVPHGPSRLRCSTLRRVMPEGRHIARITCRACGRVVEVDPAMLRGLRGPRLYRALPCIRCVDTLGGNRARADSATVRIAAGTIPLAPVQENPRALATAYCGLWLSSGQALADMVMNDSIGSDDPAKEKLCASRASLPVCFREC
jgi:hypothetical protein